MLDPFGLLEELRGRIQNNPHWGARIDHTFKLVITGDTPGVWRVAISDAGVTITPGDGPAGTMFTLSAAMARKLRNGTLRPVDIIAYDTEISWKGDNVQALRFASLVWPDEQYRKL